MNPHTSTRPAVRSISRFVHRFRTLLATAAATAIFAHLSAQPTTLMVERRGDRLQLSAPHLRFLAGPPLERLRDGRSVTYVFTVSLQVQRDGRRSARLTREVVFSYDLWEERFAVARPDAPAVSASHLTAEGAEAWCLDLLSLPVPAWRGDETLVVELACSVREDETQPADTPSTTAFTWLIDLFSRKARTAAPRWEAVSSPFRLADLKDRVPR